MNKIDIHNLLNRHHVYDDDFSGIIDLPSKPPSVLYHVTHKKNLESIKKNGLTPKVGNITQSAHGDKIHPANPLVYLADDIASGIYKSFGKNAIIITVDPRENDIWFFTGDALVQHDGSRWGKEIDEGDFPIGIEVGDYFSEEKVIPVSFYDYRGNELSVTAKYPNNKKANNPNKDITFIYESGSRDIEHPFSGESLEQLEEETEGESGSWQVDLRNLSRREKGGYPADDEAEDWGYQKDVEVYPFYYSKKGTPRGSYPIEKNWWQKALSFKSFVMSKYKVVTKK